MSSKKVEIEWSGTSFNEFKGKVYGSFLDIYLSLDNGDNISAIFISNGNDVFCLRANLIEVENRAEYRFLKIGRESSGRGSLAQLKSKGLAVKKVAILVDKNEDEPVLNPCQSEVGLFFSFESEEVLAIWADYMPMTLRISESNDDISEFIKID